MSVFNIFRRIDRRFWFICHNCLLRTNHDTVKSVFYSENPKVMLMGRPTMLCPRCNDANTRSFQELKEEGAESTVWGLERLVKKHPRSQFAVRPSRETSKVN
jgi:hypothetical protein